MKRWKLGYQTNCWGPMGGDAVGVTSATRLTYRTYANMGRAITEIAEAGFDGVEMFDGNLLDYQPTLHHGYTGLGALGAASATVVNGVPPVPAAGTSWALQLNTDVWLYADPSVGALYLYNNSGTAIRRPILTVTASGTTGKRTPP